VLPAEERCRRNGQVRPVEALQRGEVGVAELVDPLGRREVLQPVLAEVAQAVRVDERGR
jgi:hypothetical protein